MRSVLRRGGGEGETKEHRTTISMPRSYNIIKGEICVANFIPDTNSLTHFTGVCGFFLAVKFATFLLASLARENTEGDEAVHSTHNITIRGRVLARALDAVI